MVRVITTPITGSSMTSATVAGHPSPWFVTRPAGPEEWILRASQALASPAGSGWSSALGPALQATGPAAERLALAAEHGVVVTTGQQPGLFGGPLYTWWKALTALALANHLQEITGIPVAPIFWAATDDSDLAEASTTAVATPDGAEIIEMQTVAEVGTSLANVAIGDLSGQLDRLRFAAGSALNGSVLDIAANAYQPGATIGSAYVALLRHVLHPLGISVLDASHQSLRERAFPTLARALEQSEAVEKALVGRTGSIESAGFSPQVKLVSGRSLVFADRDGRRDRVAIRDARATLRNATAGSLGANVLLRPIVERSILPTVAYVGGPAEIAYFAQTTAVAEALGAAAPLVVSRWSGMVVEPRIDRLLERHGLSADDFRDPYAAETRVAKESLPIAVTKSIESLRAQVDQSMKSLTSDDASGIVPASVVEGFQRNVEHRLFRLERRFRAGVKRQGSEALENIAAVRGALYPLGKPQERVLNLLPLLARYGDSLMNPVRSEIERHAAGLAAGLG
ncbi:MAG: bacillithiol biosynthesis BshC [Gemmatimonadaceae bacterium]